MDERPDQIVRSRSQVELEGELQLLESSLQLACSSMVRTLRLIAQASPASIADDPAAAEVDGADATIPVPRSRPVSPFSTSRASETETADRDESREAAVQEASQFRQSLEERPVTGDVLSKLNERLRNVD